MTGDSPVFSGAVLCGGRSRRMGRDKALIPIDGRPMVLRVADSLRAAGASEVVAVGRDPGSLGHLGLTTLPDDNPGEGPVAGIVTALARAPDDVVLVVACDLLAPSATAMTATVAALAHHRHATVAVPRMGDRRQWAHAAWRRAAAPGLAAALAAGDRAVGHAVAIARLVLVEVDGIEPAALADADTPGELP